MMSTVKGKKKNLNTMLLLVSLVLASALLLFAVPVFANTGHDDEHGKVLELALQEIRAKQVVGPDEAIDPRKVSNEELEELGEAVMSIMHPDPRQHELMDRMMGGEGSESLARAHRRMGYNYLASDGYGECGMFNRKGGRGMMGYGMMGGLFGRGMMSFSYGGIIMWFGILILIGVVIYLAVRPQRITGRSGQGSDETPLEIAQKRFARGEITKEEYESIKKNL